VAENRGPPSDEEFDIGCSLQIIMRNIIHIMSGLILPAVVLCCLQLIAGEGVGAAGVNEPFVLERKSEQGTQLTYNFTSSLDQTMSVSGADDVRHEMKLSGSVREIVAENENEGMVALVGLIGKGKLEITSGSGSTNDIQRDQTWISAYRVGRNGESIRRELKVTAARQYHLRETMDQVSECSQICAAFPTGRVTVGSQWTGDVLLPLPGTRQSGKAVSTITSVKQTNGITYCIIRSDVTSSGLQSLDTWKPELTRPDIEVAGRTEGCFDINRGIWLETRLDLNAKFEGRSGEHGFEGVMKIKAATRILSSKLLPGEKAVEWTRRVKALDAVFGQLYGNEYEAPIQSLETQEREEADADWRNGIEVALSLIRPLADCRSEVKSGEAGKTTNAVTSVERNSNTVTSSDMKMRGQKDAVAPVMVVYKQACEYAEAGESDKALKAYEAFLSNSNNGEVPVAIRLLAQYRAADLYEKIGQRQKALAAYRAVDIIEADDDYSRKLKEKARGKAGQLSGGGM
jgi:hypothetical protein